MDDSHFKSSEELGITDDDVLFMSSFSNRLQLEPFPNYKSSQSRSLISVIALATAAAGLLWLAWPFVSEFGQLYATQMEMTLGISVSLLLGLLGLGVGLMIEGGSNQVSDIL